MKVAVVRGPSLATREMQIYEPLRERDVELLGVGSRGSNHDLAQIGFPVVRLACRGEQLSRVPGGIGWLYRRYGDPQLLIGFDLVVEGYDIVHAVELGSAFSWQAVRAKRAGLVRAVTMTVYENIPFLGDETAARKRLKDEVIEGVDHFLAANLMAKEALLAEGVEEKRISVVGQGVNTRLFKPGRLKIQDLRFKKMRKTFQMDEDDFVVLAVGRMVWEKGGYDLIRCARVLSIGHFPSSITSNIRFLLVGEGPERKRLEEMVERLGISDTMVFTGSVPYSQMPEIFRLADVFAHASLPTRDWNEQFGGVLIEAMATGLPIVATLNGGNVQTVEGESSSFRQGGFIGKGGIFVAPQDFSALAGAILRLAEAAQLRLRMGRRNRKRVVAQFDNRVIAEKIYRIWNDVLVNR